MTTLDPVVVVALRRQIAEDQLRPALDGLLAHSTASTELLQLSGRLSDLERDQLLRTESPESLETRRNQLRQNLLDLLESLVAPPPTGRPLPGTGLKKTAFFLLLVLQLVSILLILLHLSTGGYGQGEALTLIGILSPVLVGYLVTAAKGYGTPGLPAAAIRRLPVLRGLVYGAFPLYFCLLLWVLQRHPVGDWSFETARNWLIGIEAAFGGLVVFVVTTLFGEKDG